MKKFTLIFSLLIALFAFACSSDNTDSSGTDSYNRTALLTNWADNIIIPAFTNYQDKTQLLSAKVISYNANPSQTGLNDVRAAWLDAYNAFQKVGMFHIGKAEEIYFKESANTYPTDVAGISVNIAAGTTDLTAISQISKQGFPAIDYMINGLGTSDSEILDFYTSNANAANYKAYLSALSARLETQANVILTDWNGEYRTTFINNSGNGASSSVNKITNNFVKYFEKDIRAAKVGVPAGVFSNEVKFPEKVEAYYRNDVSKELLVTSMQAALDFFNGKHFATATTGESLNSYLVFINAVRDGQNLSDIIVAQFTTAASAIGTLDSSFSQQIFSNNATMLTVYDAMQQNVVYLKLDMMQALNITVDYVDSDGD